MYYYMACELPGDKDHYECMLGLHHFIVMPILPNIFMLYMWSQKKKVKSAFKSLCVCSTTDELFVTIKAFFASSVIL
jgi:hypothetical protein